jgi:hypothetical protein
MLIDKNTTKGMAIMAIPCTNIPQKAFSFFE